MAKRKTLEEVSRRYCNRVKEVRLMALVATQEELAKLTGINRTTINALENNRQFLSSHYALLIAEVLRCNVSDLYKQRYEGRGDRSDESGIVA